MKIFICENDVNKARSMQAVLDVYSYKVVTVHRHVDLFRQVSSQKPAVIILNENFTEEGGVDTLNRLRMDPHTSNIPVIYIGASKGLTTNRENFLECVNEPVKIKNLRHYIDRWTTLRSLYVKH